MTNQIAEREAGNTNAPHVKSLTARVTELETDNASLAVAVGDLQREIVSAKGEVLTAKEALVWAERGRDGNVIEMGRHGAEYRARIETVESENSNVKRALKEKADPLEQKRGTEMKGARDKAQSPLESKYDVLRCAIDAYLTDLGYPCDPHSSTISCPTLRRFVSDVG